MEYSLTATASALKAFTRRRHPIILPTDHTAIRSLLSEFNTFLERLRVPIVITVKQFKSDPERDMLMVTPTAIETICECLAWLATQRYLPLDDDCPSKPVVRRLYKICKSQGGEYEAARTHLHTYRHPPPGPGAGVSTVDSGESRRETRAPTATPNVSPADDDDDDGTPAFDSVQEAAENVAVIHTRRRR